MFGASALVTIDEWELRGETIRVEFRTTSAYVDVTVATTWPEEYAESARFATVGEAERWYTRFARGLVHGGARRRGRTVVESFGPSASFRAYGFGGGIPGGGAHRGRDERSGARPTPDATQRLSEAYRMLGVSPGVSELELRTAYRRLALRWHPDRCDDPSADERMGAINRAYDQIRRSEGLAS